MKSELLIATLPGDGIGVEVMQGCLAVLETLRERSGGSRLHFEEYPGGAQHSADTGVAFPESSMVASRKADAVLSGAMMLDWFAATHGANALCTAALRLERAVDAVYASRKVVPLEFGGKDGTAAIARAVVEVL